MEGVFKDLVNERSFLDKVVVSVWGKRKAAIGPGVILPRNSPIGGANRPYARLVRAKSWSGNAVAWKYGVFTRASWRHKLAPIQTILRSDRVPISCAEFRMFTENIACARYRELVSQVELTFDTHGQDLKEIERRTFTAAKNCDLKQDKHGRRTLYIGSARSAWQVRVYQKTSAIVRFEFIFRPAFLRVLRISAAHELLLLKRVNLATLVRWPDEKSLSILNQFMRHEQGWRLEASLDLCRYSAQEGERILRSYGVNTSGLFPESTLDRTLRRMQSRLIW